MNWIDVRNWKPQIFVSVLVIVRGENKDIITQALMDEEGEWFYECSVNLCERLPIHKICKFGSVTHWTLLPKLPFSEIKK